MAGSCRRLSICSSKILLRFTGLTYILVSLLRPVVRQDINSQVRSRMIDVQTAVRKFDCLHHRKSGWDAPSVPVLEMNRPSALVRKYDSVHHFRNVRFRVVAERIG
jgi:hypothetical protein